MTARELARQILEDHEVQTRSLEVDPVTRHIIDVGEAPRNRWWCDGDGHDDALGGPWPCDAVRLAILVIEESRPRKVRPSVMEVSPW